MGALPHGLAVEGHDDATIDRIRCPIGLPGPASKLPAAIAVSVAAELMDLLATDRSRVIG